ncbi:hypothetical protein EDF64_10454 [Curtobacterium flaccumfaciens]|uniref:Uncharacterized protein n=1 Tax=Curtobacterium flaccumfaciens TaxID=2035 RepID=A0A4V3BKZ4_9MICO|nr:hypothetical protein EDF64_10454 [Curtobacterium flaccumfaciens]
MTDKKPREEAIEKVEEAHEEEKRRAEEAEEKRLE